MGILKRTILWMSESQFIYHFLMVFPGFRSLTRRFVAGENVREALRVVDKLEKKGIKGTLDLLGENLTTKRAIEDNVDEYVSILDVVGRRDVQLGVKLSSLGLKQGKVFCEHNLRVVCQRAKRYGIIVSIDMEDAATTEDTLEIYHNTRKNYQNVGVCVQAYLYRTMGDAVKLIKKPSIIRLVKGTYDEPENIAFEKAEAVQRNFKHVAKEILGDLKNKRYNKYHQVHIATHNAKLIDWTKKFMEEHKINKKSVEFQMLYGIATRKQKQLAKQGYKVRVYIPFGTKWYPYYMRRLAERPENLWFLLRHLF